MGWTHRESTHFLFLPGFFLGAILLLARQRRHLVRWRKRRTCDFLLRWWLGSMNICTHTLSLRAPSRDLV
jgi:hypothetical protein